MYTGFSSGFKRNQMQTPTSIAMTQSLIDNAVKNINISGDVSGDMFAINANNEIEPIGDLPIRTSEMKISTVDEEDDDSVANINFLNSTYETISNHNADKLTLQNQITILNTNAVQKDNSGNVNLNGDLTITRNMNTFKFTNSSGFQMFYSGHLNDYIFKVDEDGWIYCGERLAMGSSASSPAVEFKVDFDGKSLFVDDSQGDGFQFNGNLTVSNNLQTDELTVDGETTLNDIVSIHNDLTMADSAEIVFESNGASTALNKTVLDSLINGSGVQTVKSTDSKSTSDSTVTTPGYINQYYYDKTAVDNMFSGISGSYYKVLKSKKVVNIDDDPTPLSETQTIAAETVKKLIDLSFDWTDFPTPETGDFVELWIYGTIAIRAYSSSYPETFIGRDNGTAGVSSLALVIATTVSVPLNWSVLDIDAPESGYKTIVLSINTLARVPANAILNVSGNNKLTYYSANHTDNQITFIIDSLSILATHYRIANSS